MVGGQRSENFTNTISTIAAVPPHQTFGVVATLCRYFPARSGRPPSRSLYRQELAGTWEVLKGHPTAIGGVIVGARSNSWSSPGPIPFTITPTRGNFPPLFPGESGNLPHRLSRRQSMQAELHIVFRGTIPWRKTTVKDVNGKRGRITNLSNRRLSKTSCAASDPIRRGSWLHNGRHSGHIKSQYAPGSKRSIRRFNVGVSPLLVQGACSLQVNIHTPNETRGP